MKYPAPYFKRLWCWLRSRIRRSPSHFILSY